ncbi:MAG: M23 family metallopeptidase [Myxococcales bacterium]|jgi:murein DD-endopeptidase|nr:M23 family metallopeptidase [Myxococcales bacterium]MBL0194102.1 M23 family metallopeptidase [Myxococcales bacterium]HQY60206.1 M23 family metallopeptidase [Polyangiaceae bacterium]
MKLTLREAFALDDIPRSLRDTLLVFRGDDNVLPAKWGLASTKQLRPRLGFSLWRGKALHGRRIPLMNLFNHTPTPVEEGWSTLVTQVRDFRGGTNTYDSHNGTDFAIPPGTPVCAAAPGRITHVINEYNRGGLKVVIDHGGHLLTSSNHLARAEVRVGDLVERGQVVAHSGYSGLDGLLTFPFGIPHVHYNVWLNGVAVDPFASDSEVSLWRDHNAPTPHRAADGGEPEVLPDTDLDLVGMSDALALCKDRRVRAELAAIRDPGLLATRLVFQHVTYPLRFSAAPRVYRSERPRAPRLDLPFRAEDFDGVVQLD